MTIIFLETKIRLLGSLQKYLKSGTILCFCPKECSVAALVGKTKEMYNLLLGELNPRTKLVGGTLEILADGTTNLDRWRNNSQGKPRALNQWREHKKESREYNKQQHKRTRSDRSTKGR